MKFEKILLIIFIKNKPKKKNSNEPDYFQSLNLHANEKEIKFKNVVASQGFNKNMDKEYPEKFKSLFSSNN